MNRSTLVNKVWNLDFHKAVESDFHQITASAEKNIKFCVFISSHKDWKPLLLFHFFVSIQLVRSQESAKFELQPHSSRIIITMSTSGFQTLSTRTYLFKIILPLCLQLGSAAHCLIVDNLLTIWNKVVTFFPSKVYFIDKRYRDILLWLSKWILQNQHLILLQIRTFSIGTLPSFLV